MPGTLIQLARFTTVTSNVPTPGNSFGVGVFVRPWTPLQLVQVGYSFYDNAKVFNPSSNTFQSRIAVLRGFYDGDPTTFKVDTDLSRWSTNIIGDFYLNDIGPGVIPFHPDAIEAVVQEGDGMSILLAAAQTNATGTAFIGKLSPLSRSFMPHGLVRRQRMAGAAAAASAGFGVQGIHGAASTGGGGTHGGIPRQ